MYFIHFFLFLTSKLLLSYLQGSYDSQTANDQQLNFGGSAENLGCRRKSVTGSCETQGTSWQFCLGGYCDLNKLEAEMSVTKYFNMTVKFKRGFSKSLPLCFWLKNHSCLLPGVVLS